MLSGAVGSQVITFDSANPSNVGSNSFTIIGQVRTGATLYSKLIQTFTVAVGCTTLSLTPNPVDNPVFNTLSSRWELNEFIYIVGSGPQRIGFSLFQMSPLCTLTITYAFKTDLPSQRVPALISTSSNLSAGSGSILVQTDSRSDALATRSFRLIVVATLTQIDGSLLT